MLRARRDADVPLLYEQLHNDVETRCRADPRPWTPVPASRTSYGAEPSDGNACFSVVEPAASDGPAADRLVGDAVLWAIDAHNRSAHVGLSLFPSARGRGIGTDVVRTLCVYGFVVRGLHRLQIETLADNPAMIAAATRAGFTREGTLRGSSWAYGRFVDEVVLGLLVDEWPGGR